jgi:hypothetical protein
MESRYSELVMRGAFVVQLLKTQDRHFEGSVEEVDTGIQTRFVTETELIGFLRDRFSRTAYPQKGATNERNNAG